MPGSTHTRGLLRVGRLGVSVCVRCGAAFSTGSYLLQEPTPDSVPTPKLVGDPHPYCLCTGTPALQVLAQDQEREMERLELLDLHRRQLSDLQMAEIQVCSPTRNARLSIVHPAPWVSPVRPKIPPSLSCSPLAIHPYLGPASGRDV